MTYDRADNKIGFWKTNCSELWKSLNNEHAPPPASNGQNMSGEIAPDIAPAGLPQTVLPGRVRYLLLLGSKGRNMKSWII